MASNTAVRFLHQSKVKAAAAWRLPQLQQQVRGLSAASGYTHDEPIPANYTIDSVKPPQYWNKPDGESMSVVLLCGYSYVFFV